MLIIKHYIIYHRTADIFWCGPSVEKISRALPTLVMTAGCSSLPTQDGITSSFICFHVPFLWQREVTAYGKREYYEDI